MLLYGKCNKLLGEKDQVESDKRLDMVDEQFFTFKRKVNKWLKCAGEGQQPHAMLEKSRSLKESSSKSSHHSSKSSASRKLSRSVTLLFLNNNIFDSCPENCLSFSKKLRKNSLEIV